MTSISRSLEDFISRLKATEKELRSELADLEQRSKDLKKAKETLQSLQTESGIIAGYNAQALKDIEQRISYIPKQIERALEKVTSVTGALDHAIRYDRETCQHDLEVSGHDYHNNVAEYTCRKCGVHR